MASVIIDSYQKSINSAGFSETEVNLIWEFYVTKAITKTCAQKRAVRDYGIRQLPWTDMKKSAGLVDDKVKILPANSINQTLENLGLETKRKEKDENGKSKTADTEIEIDTPRIACLTPFSVSDDNPPKANIGDAESVLTHIRNSFAHGLTYFFDNGNALLEDRDQRGGITARFILHKQTLLDWIYLVDKNEKFYKSPVEGGEVNE